jgi:hypothetical protein
MPVTLDQIKGIIQVIVPVIVAVFAPKYIPADQVTGFDAALVTVVVTIFGAIWSARTTKTEPKP